METLARHAFDAIRGNTGSPFEAEHLQFKDSWNSLAPKITMDRLNKFNMKELIGSELETLSHEVLQFCNHALASSTFKRGDYQELCELIVLYLGGNVPNFKFKRPGACHHARFMAKAIYSLKMSLCSQFYAMDRDTEKILQRTALFCALFYGPWFLKSSISQSAPRMDIEIIAQMNVYQEYDAVTSKAVLKALQLQAWYLNPFMVAMTLADDDANIDDRCSIAKKLLETEVPTTFTVGKPTFPNIHKDLKLVDLVDQDTWFLFHVQGMEQDDRHKWLGEDVARWYDDPDYRAFERFIKKIDVVNDRAERGVKLIQEFISSSRTEEDLQDLLHVVNKEMTKMSHLSKVLSAFLLLQINFTVHFSFCPPPPQGKENGLGKR